MCVQTLLIWSCDHGRIPSRRNTIGYLQKYLNNIGVTLL